MFADVEGSTRHLLRLGERYAPAMERQTAVLIDAVERNRGHLIDTSGDGSFAAFPDRPDDQ